MVLRIIDAPLLDMFQKVDACLSVSKDGPFVLKFVFFMCNGFRSSLNHLVYFTAVLVNIYVLL